jgi:hypothetical protein
MNVGRREFLKIAALTAGSLMLGTGEAEAKAKGIRCPEFVNRRVVVKVLVDIPPYQGQKAVYESVQSRRLPVRPSADRKKCEALVPEVPLVIRNGKGEPVRVDEKFRIEEVQGR